MITRQLLTATLLASSVVAGAQTELGVFSATGRGAATPFVTDYHAIGINPANLNLKSEYDGKSVTFGFVEGAASMYSGFLSKDEVRSSLFRQDFQTLDQNERRAYAQAMEGETTVINLNMISAGVAVNSERAGGFAFSTRERITMSSRFGSTASELIFLGRTASYFSDLVLTSGDTIPNTGNLSADTLNMVQQGVISPQEAMMLSQALDGTAVGFSWIREINVAYGKRILRTDDLELHAGIGAKLLIGNAWMQVDVDGSNITAFSALSPLFGINYGEIADQNPSALPQSASAMRPVGYGWGIDIGATLLFKDRLIVSAAVNDIGRMKWNGNVYTLNDAILTEFSDPGAETADIVQEIVNFASPESLLNWEGAQSQTTNLPAVARLGVGLIVNDKLRLAADAVVPVNDNVVNYDRPIYAFGVDLTPVPFVRLSSGIIAGDGRDMLIPVGVTFVIGEGSWEFGVASRDLVTWFSQNNPTLSASWGFLRFRV